MFVSVCYLALLGPEHCHARGGPEWRSWYDFLPWEDWRSGRPACLTERIEPWLKAWAEQQPAPYAANGSLDRRQRLRIAFGCDGGGWDEEKVLERYELLCEAGLAGEADERLRRARRPCGCRGCGIPCSAISARAGQRHRRDAAQRQVPAR